MCSFLLEEQYVQEFRQHNLEVIFQKNGTKINYYYRMNEGLM